MAVITMKQLLEAGVHFGHQTRKWNPKMKKYIFAARNDIHIIDLQLTVGLVEKAYNFVVDTVKAGKSILFVGTKKQAQEAISTSIPAGWAARSPTLRPSVPVSTASTGWRRWRRTANSTFCPKRKFWA